MKGERAGRSAAVFFSMIEKGVAGHDIKEPRGFHLIEDIIIMRRKIRVVQDAHRGGVESTGLIQPFDEINLDRAFWGWLHLIFDTSQRDFVTAPGLSFSYIYSVGLQTAARIPNAGQVGSGFPFRLAIGMHGFEGAYEPLQVPRSRGQRSGCT